jgi:mRNA interferase RelE/StbE
VYKLKIKRSARKELDGIPDSDFLKIDKSTLSLKEKQCPHPQSRKLQGINTRRLRVGSYRIIYNVDERQKVVTVYRVRHRKDAYR